MTKGHVERVLGALAMLRRQWTTKGPQRRVLAHLLHFVLQLDPVVDEASSVLELARALVAVNAMG